MGVMGAWRARSYFLLLCPFLAEAQDPVDFWGQLAVQNNRIISTKTGLPVRLRGMSLYESQETPEFWNRDVVLWLAKDWKCTLIRAAMGVEWGGYLTNPEEEEAKVRTVVNAAIEAGIYVLIDWHDHNAMWHTDAAIEFFTAMARDFGAYPNVLFEPWSEPEEWHGWSAHIKPYHQMIVPYIRQHTENLIVLGTGTWGQRVDEASLSPVPGSNLAYTLHWYGASHFQWLVDRVVAASDSVAIFATEWGVCEHWGGGALNYQNTEIWLDLHKRFSISDANWAISDRAESCAALRVGTSATPPWGPEDLTASGQFVRQSIIDDWTFPDPTFTATTTTTASTTTTSTSSATQTHTSFTETNTTMSNFTTTTTSTGTTSTGTTSTATATGTSVTVTDTSLTTSTTLTSTTTGTSATTSSSTVTSTTVLPRQSPMPQYEFLSPGEVLGVALPSAANAAHGVWFALVLVLVHHTTMAATGFA